MTLPVLIKLMRDFAKGHNKRLFTLKEVSLFANQTPAAVGMTLIRAKRQGLVGRVKNLWINMLDKPTLEEIALELKSPSYISFESALYRHGILSQSPRGALLVATTLKPSKVTTPLGNIHFIHLSGELFFGFDETRTAAPEKAFLDTLYIKIRRGQNEITEVFYTDLLNKRKLGAMAKRFPSYVRKALSLYGFRRV